MKKERILAFQLAQKLDENDLQAVTGGSFTCSGTSTGPDNYGNYKRDPGCEYDFE